jgi:hypothetical protein
MEIRSRADARSPYLASWSNDVIGRHGEPVSSG